MMAEPPEFEGEFHSLEVRPVAFRGGVRDIEGLMNDGAENLSGMSLAVEQCMRHENDAYDRLCKPC